ncbi:hypothetical protein GQR58_028927 [Nymphon striatum]|nr:hypothetical protein GQR58_028927 [Nymphon striatum]
MPETAFLKLTLLAAKLSRAGLIITVVLLTIAGHLGASLTHGEDYLTSVLPGNQDKYDNTKENKAGVFKGGESGIVILPGDAAKSELFKRISLSPNEEGVMPKKGKVLKDNEIELIKLWIDNGAHWSDQALKVFPEAEMALVKPILPESQEKNPVDKIIGAYFEEQHIVGLLPQPEAITAFVNNKNPNKREQLIDSLLADTNNYTQHWLSFWNDLLRNDYSGTGFITRGRKQITDWLYTSLEENKSYDQMVAELVNPIEGSEGFIEGIQWRGVINASQRTEMQAAQNIGQSLMGTNVKCASCPQ